MREGHLLRFRGIGAKWELFPNLAPVYTPHQTDRDPAGVETRGNRFCHLNFRVPQKPIRRFEASGAIETEPSVATARGPTQLMSKDSHAELGNESRSLSCS